MMVTPSFAPQSVRERRLSLAEIDALVSARLGPTRGLGNSQPACFNRQIAMYLAARVGRWSTTIIGHFYGGRDHSTVRYGILRIASLSESDPEVDALLADLRRRLGETCSDRAEEMRLVRFEADRPELSDNEVERIAAAVVEKIRERFETERKASFPRDFRGASGE